MLGIQDLELFSLPEEHRLLQKSLRRYVDQEMIPVEMESFDGAEYREGFLTRFQDGMKNLGLWLMDAPEEFGGAGLDLLAKAVVWSELGRTTAIPARDDQITGPTVRSILYSLEGDLRDRYLLPVLQGEKRSCFAQTEPDAGSDPGSMKTTAVLNGDYYVINGTKRFITGADKADFMQLMAATDRTRGSRGGISCFLVDMSTPGVLIGRCDRTMMGDSTWEISLTDVRVPRSQLVGEEGGGFALAQEWLCAGRVKHGARALGVAERALEMATSYAKQRTTFGQPLSKRQGIQWMLGDIYMDLQIGRMLVWSAAAKVDGGGDARIEAFHCKYFCDEMAFRAIDVCMQIHGGAGLMTELPIERMWRQQRSYRITEGASEVVRDVMARHVLKTY